MRGRVESTHSSSTPPSNAPSWAICAPSLRDESPTTVSIVHIWYKLLPDFWQPSRDFESSSSVTPTQDMNASTGVRISLTFNASQHF